MSQAEAELCAAFEQPSGPPEKEEFDSEMVNHVLDVKNKTYPLYQPTYEQHLAALAR